MLSNSKNFNKLLVNILIGIGLITIPILTSPDIGAGFGLFSIPPFLRNFISYLILACFFYVSYYLIIPKFYFPKKWILFTLFILIGYLLAIKLPQFIIPDSEIFNFQKHSRPPALHHENPILNFLLARDYHVLQFMGVFLLSLFLRLNEHLNNVKNKKLLTEIAYLKSQVNPHFLFNTLNSLYALALTKSEKTPETILKLSDLMRYVVVESSNMFVDLDKEINYVKNFIDLQRLRITNNTELSTNFKGNFKNHKITPLILISLIENAFKYGIDVESKSKIILSFVIEDNLLKVNAENTIVNKIKRQKSTNKGIKNTRKQLEIFYPDKHTLKIKRDENYYKAKLEIQL